MKNVKHAKTWHLSVVIRFHIIQEHSFCVLFLFCFHQHNTSKWYWCHLQNNYIYAGWPTELLYYAKPSVILLTFICYATDLYLNACRCFKPGMKESSLWENIILVWAKICLSLMHYSQLMNCCCVLFILTTVKLINRHCVLSVQ